MLKQKTKYGTKEFVLGITVCIGIAVILIFLPFFLGKPSTTYPQPTYWDDVSAAGIGWYYFVTWFIGAIKLSAIILFAKGVQIAVDDIKKWKQSKTYQRLSSIWKATYSFFIKIGVNISKRFNHGRDNKPATNKE